MSEERPVEASVEGAWREARELDAALERGEIDEAGWHRAWQELLVPAYLAAASPRAQSGHSGDEARWTEARRPITDAIGRPGTFLDVGCANGYLMESVARWSPHAIEPYGLELAPELAALARSRLPHWADRIFVGNALDWVGPRRFDFVRTGLDYVPKRRRCDLVEHLLEHVVAPGGRLIVGVQNEVRSAERLEVEFEVAGRREWPKPDDDRVVRTLFWIDASSAAWSER